MKSFLHDTSSLIYKEYIAIWAHALFSTVNLKYLEMQHARTPHREHSSRVWPKKRSSPLLLFRISGRSTEIRWIMHGQSRGVAPRCLFPIHTMHMSSDRWMCQFHRGLVSIPSPGLSSSTRRLRCARPLSQVRTCCCSKRVIFLGVINLPPIPDTRE